MSQGYAELSKVNPGHARRIAEMFGKRGKNTVADAGSLKIGSNEFTILIPNGYGDGVTTYAIFDSENELNCNMLNYQTTISGTFGIFAYDCGDEIVETVSGRFQVYSARGFVAFVRI